MADDELRRQRVLRLQARLLEASEQFPMFNHFAMRSDDPLCWNALANEPIDSVPDIPRSPFVPNSHLCARWDQHFEKRFATQDDERHERSSLEYDTHRWVWEAVLFTKYHYGTECVKSPTQWLKVAGTNWIGVFADPTALDIHLPGHHRLTQFGSEILAEVCDDSLSSKASQVAEWNIRDRLLVETLYREFPQQPTQHGPIEIITLPWNVFLTTARLIERRMSSPPASPRSFTPAELSLRLGGMDSDTLARYAAKAGVKRPGRGGRNFRYDQTAATVISRVIIADCPTTEFLRGARALLQELTGESVV